MRQLVPIFLLMATLTTMACAQDSAATQPPPTTQSRSGDYGYGGRAELFVNGFGLFGNGTSGNAINQQETQSGGVSVGYRFHLNAVSALEGRYGFSRDSQKYTIGGTGGTVSSVPAYLSEISASYVYSLPKSRYLQPFLEGGGEGWSYSFPAITVAVPRHPIPSTAALRPVFKRRRKACLFTEVARMFLSCHE
jgi:hypothetical protein